MKSRHVFSTPDLPTARAALEAARRAGIGDGCLSLVARSDIELEDIPSDYQEADSDFIPAALRGAGYGGAAGLLAGLVAVAVTPIGLTLAGAAAAAAGGALLGSWASSLFGASLPDPVRREFDQQIRAGRILLLVDADREHLCRAEPAILATGATPLSVGAIDQARFVAERASATKRAAAFAGTPRSVFDRNDPMDGAPYEAAQVEELLYQALETEIGGETVYELAVQCAINPELKREFQQYLEQTRNHRLVLLDVFDELDLDPATRTPGREVVKHLAESLVEAIEMAMRGPDPRAAELVAAECVVLAETKDQMNWQLIGRVARQGAGNATSALLRACGEVEEEEDRHLDHSTGWARELWLDSLGLPASLPPPEERPLARDRNDATPAAREGGRLM